MKPHGRCKDIFATPFNSVFYNNVYRCSDVFKTLLRYSLFHDVVKTCGNNLLRDFLAIYLTYNISLICCNSYKDKPF